MKKILFAPPYITSKEIRLVKKVLKSGWVTTGPMVMSFESLLKDYVQAERVLCLSSATAGLELVLRLYGVGEGDEVITTPYTFTATAAVAIHVGAKPVLVDIGDDFNISPDKIYDAITEKTKAIIPVDFGGKPCDYDRIFSVVNSKSYLFKPKNSFQESLGRPLIIGDAAHSFGSIYKSKKVGTLADFTVFSFHAVKNITTAEGGAIALNLPKNIDQEKGYKEMRLMTLNGQTKDAYAKTKAGGWKYDIVLGGLKVNMPDVLAAIGLAQIRKYKNFLLPERKRVAKTYERLLKPYNWALLPCLENDSTETSYHIYPLRIKNITEAQRDMIINEISHHKVAVNVHFIPLPMLTFFKQMGYCINDYPNAYKNYCCEISLPIYPQLNDSQVQLVVDTLVNAYNKVVL